MMRVLVLRALGLGDLLTAVPALRGLRRAWPDAQLALACPEELGTWLLGHGVVDEVCPVPGVEEAPGILSQLAACDVAVDLHGCGPRSEKGIRATGASRLVGFCCPQRPEFDGPPWRSAEHEVDRWIRLAHSVRGQATPQDLRLRHRRQQADHVVIHPGAASGSRRWPLHRWTEVAQAMVRSGRSVVVTGVPGEQTLCSQLQDCIPQIENRCGQDDLVSLESVVASASLILSGDTGIAHLATALRIPSVTLFGPVSPVLWGPRIDRELHTVLWRGAPTSLRPGDPHAADLDPRLAAITVAEVLGAARHLLGPERRPVVPVSSGSSPSARPGRPHPAA